MANTVKVLGHGPLAGQVFYGTVTDVAGRLDRSEVTLDGGPGVAWFCTESGYMSPAEGVTTDLLRIEPGDKGKFRDMSIAHLRSEESYG